MVWSCSIVLVYFWWRFFRLLNSICSLLYIATSKNGDICFNHWLLAVRMGWSFHRPHNAGQGLMFTRPPSRQGHSLASDPGLPLPHLGQPAEDGAWEKINGSLSWSRCVCREQERKCTSVCVMERLYAAIWNKSYFQWHKFNISQP